MDQSNVPPTTPPSDKPTSPTPYQAPPEAPPQQVVDATPTVAPPTQTAQPLILLVEDEDFIRDIFKRQLDLSGLQTEAFPNGKEGLNAVAQKNYSLILLDIMLPDMNGLEILKNIKENPAKKDIPVVMLTNLGQDAVIKQGFDLGATGYLIKAAYTPDQVVQEVKNILANKPSPATTLKPA